MSGSEEEAAHAAGRTGGGGGSGSGGGAGGSSGSGGEGHQRRRFDDKSLVARTSLILWHTHQNDAAAVRKLLDEDGTLVNARDYDSRTPLHVAALHGWQDVAECLVAKGADVNALDRWQNTVILPPSPFRLVSSSRLLVGNGGVGASVLGWIRVTMRSGLPSRAEIVRVCRLC